MKEIAVSAWKWILVSVLLLSIGVLLAVGLGRKRGSTSYRWRMALWTAALTLLGGGMMITAAGCDKEKEEPTCYKPAMEDVLDIQGEDGRIFCYAPEQPDALIECYAPLPPDIHDAKQPDVQVMCYEAPEDYFTNPQDTVQQPDEMIMCYEPVFDAYTPPEDVQVTCYAPLPPDMTEHQDVVAEEDVPIMCYDPALPEDVKEEKEDVPMPTCYAPPPPQE